ncbi:toxin C-terminal domain-containing protein [Variovorax sp. J31P216]|uniref:two-partner secretion domain-containing protein n=1 Tax=Variovorax saccharolyticus TaxID=3053516 RepID=UPI0025778C15|nr:toxin C-terminal domain-containing protein [Variovorax sp. J31P216]MDM0030484.1 toxin C-terminal domain-containing protein [Variovorax sp. J31P216]
MRGYVEVAGPRAEVIIANPSGIQVEGGGFINAHRVTLTTGVPQLNAFGGIESYRVTGGAIGVSGAGLDARDTEFAALYARMVSINAAVWGGGELRVVTGANQVSADGAPGVAANVTPIAGTGPTAPLAFDVAALGGMYAQKIWIMGTAAGVGARNAGTIQTGAGSAALMGIGELTVTASGRLENIGTLQAAADAHLVAPTVANSGTVRSAGSTRIVTQGDLVNAGTVEGARLELASAAGDVINSGTLRQTGLAALTLAAPALVNTNGGAIGYEPAVQSTGSTADTGTAGGTGGSAGTGSIGMGVAGAATGAAVGGTATTSAPVAAGTITAAGAIRNDGGHVFAGGPIELQTPNVMNAGGKLEVSSLTVSGATFGNAGGTVRVAHAFSANVGRFDNSAGGTLSAGSVAIATTGDFNNQDGTIESDAGVLLVVGGAAHNAHGAVSAAGALTARVAGTTDNTSGSLIGNQAVTLQAQSLNNTLGAVASTAARTSLSLTNALVNSGHIGAATDLSVQAGSLSNGAGGSLRAGNDATLAIAGSATNDGRITAQRHTTLTADSLQGSVDGVLGAGIQSDGSLGGVGNLNVATTGALIAQGANLAAGNATLQGASVDLSGSQTRAQAIALTATQGDVTTRHATVATPNTLSITANAQATQTLVNEAGVLNAGTLDLHAAHIANINGGQIVQTGTGALAIAVTGSFDNTGGRLASNSQDLHLAAATFTNTGGRIEHAGTGALSIAGGSFDGAGGTLVSNGALAVALSGAFKQNGGSATARQISMDAGSLSTRGGAIVQTGTGATRIAVAGALDNSNAGSIASNGATILTAGSLNNRSGSIRTTGISDLSITATNLLDNSAQGEIGAGGSATFAAGSLANDSGRLTAVRDLAATVAGAATNVGGTLAANGATTITAARLDNTRGTAAAVSGDLRVTTTGATVNAFGTMQAGARAVLANGGLDNTAGKVLGQAVAIDTHATALTNTQGTLAAATTVAVSSGALTNDAGLIQSGGAMTVNTNGQSLTNTNAALHASGQGGITSADTLQLAAGALTNIAGFIGAKNALSASTQAFANTGGGAVLGQSSVAIDTQGAAYDNSGGQTQALGDLSVTADSVANTAGLLRSGATTTLHAASIVNRNTLGAHQGIEGRNVALNVGSSLDNTLGAIRAEVNATITSGGTFNNAAGLVSAGQTLRIVDPKAATPAAKTLGFMNTGGTAVAGRSLQLDAATFSADGALNTGRDLRIALTQDLVNNAQLSVRGDLSYTTTGNLVNHGKLQAGGTLTTGGNGVENTVGAEMSGTDTFIQAGTLNNRGLIDSQGQTRIDAGTVNNTGTGRIYGDAVAIGAGTLNNDAETVAGVTSAATIAGRSSVDLGAVTVNNRDGALAFSAGDLFIGGALDANGFATGTGSVLNNLSATVEALGDMAIGMASVNNLDTHLQVVQQTSSTLDRSLVTTSDLKRWSVADTRGDPLTGQVWHRNADGSESLVGIGYADWNLTATTVKDVATNLAPARLAAGGSMTIDGQLLNRDSQVTAGGALTAASVVNQATQGTSTTSYSGFVMGFDGSGGGAMFPVAPYADPTMTVNVGAYTYTPNANATAGYNAGAAPGVSAPGATAASTGSVSNAGGPGTVIQVASAVGGTSSVGGSPVGTAGGGNGAVGAAVATPATPMVVRTRTPASRLPTASLFANRPETGARYLVETDPRFANYRQWLSSDYLLQALGFDPERMQKRLGDGFYEEKLIREQVAQLTGYRFLDGYVSDEAQYTALMNAGVTFAQAYPLTPGIALTATQMAQLTSDIVWLVEQTVTLPDGSTQKVLAPQVYVRVQPGDIDGSGALLSAERLTLQNQPGAGDFTNSGTVAGRELVAITADTIDNLAGRISGGNVALDARGDLNSLGGTITGRDSVSLTAAGDIRIETTVSSSSNALSSTGQSNKTRIDSIAGVYVTNPGGTLVASAGNDVHLIGAILENKGQGGYTSVTAKHDLILGTVTERESLIALIPGKAGSASSSRETGTTITTHGTTVLGAGNDITARQADVDAGSGLLVASAGRNLDIVDGQAKDSSAYISQSTRKSTFSKTTETLTASQESATSVGSRFSGGLVSLHADNNVNIVGSHISGTQGVSVTAAKQLNVVEGRDSRRSSAGLSRTGSFEFLDRHLSQEKKVGNTLETHTDNAAASSITSAQGGVYLEGGNGVSLRGAQLGADKDLTIKGGEVTITAAVNEAGLKVGNSSSKKSNVSSALHGLDGKGENTQDADTSSLTNSHLSGANVSITATGDNGTSGAVTIGGTTIDTPGKLLLEGDSVNLALQSTESHISHTGGKNNLMWQSTKDSGRSDKTLNYNQIDAGSLEVNASRVTVGMNAKDSVEALSKQPGMEWIGQLNSHPNLAGKIDWQAIEAAHKQWDNGKSGLTPEGAAVVTAVVTYLTWGAASGAGAYVAGGVAGGSTAVAGAVAAGISALASQATVALINNKGDLGKTFDDLGSSASVKNLVTAIVTGGVLGGLNLNPTGLPTTGAGAGDIMKQLGTNLTAGAAKAVISTAINGGSLEDALREGIVNAFLDTAAATGANWIGGTDGIANKIAHAIAGCAIGAARPDGSCAAGALGAVIGELSAELYGRDFDTVQFAAMMSSIAAAAAGGDANQINLAGQAGANAAANNYLSHSPFAEVKILAAKENARLTAACEPKCTQVDFDRIDQQVAAVERAANLVEMAKRGVITVDQAQQLAQTLLELAPIYGSGESALQLITGKASLTGEEGSRVWAAVGLVPIAGGMVRKVGEPAVDALISTLRAFDGPVFKTTREATQAAKALGYRRINETVNGQAVFTDGKNYISRDFDSHSGGAWKMADSIKELSSRDTRAGTFNADLTKRIGD